MRERERESKRTNRKKTPMQDNEEMDILYTQIAVGLSHGWFIT